MTGLKLKLPDPNSTVSDKTKLAFSNCVGSHFVLWFCIHKTIQGSLLFTLWVYSKNAIKLSHVCDNRAAIESVDVWELAPVVHECVHESMYHGVGV